MECDFVQKVYLLLSSLDKLSQGSVACDGVLDFLQQ